MVRKKLQAYVNICHIEALFRVLAVVTFCLGSGCTVALSPLALKEQTLYHEGKFEEARQYLEGENGRLSPNEKRRILNENIYKIKTSQETTMEFVKYRMGHEYLAKSLIELGEFKRALKVCDDGIKESEMLSDLFKRYRYSYTSSKEHNYEVQNDLMRLKGYILWFETGDKDKATEYFNRSVSSVPTNNQDISYLDSLSKQKIEFLLDSGYFYDKILGKHREALEYFQEVLKLTDKLTLLDIDGKYAYCMQSYLRIMNIDMKLGKLEDAKKALDKYYDQAGHLIFKIGKIGASSSEIFRGYLSIMDSQAGALYALARDFNKSKDFFDKSLRTINRIDPNSQNMWDLKAIGTYYVLYGTYYFGLQDKIKEAIENTDRGLNYLRPYYLTAIMDELDIENAYIYSGELHFKNKDYEMAQNRAAKALDYSNRKHNVVAAATALTLLGQSHYMKNEKKEAKQAYERAFKLVENIESTENWKLYYGLGQVNEYFGNQVKALKYYERAVVEVEKLWNGRFKDTPKQVSFIDNRLVVFEPIIRLLHEQGNDQEAVLYMERSKSRTFYETSPYYSEEPVNKKNGSISKFLTTSEMRKAVPDKTAILEYYVGEHSVIAAVIIKKGVHVKELQKATPDTLQKDVIALKLV